jgi:signal transduction histidine kinase
VITNDCPEELMADENLLNQLMINILKNAMDALTLTVDKKITIRLGKNQAGRLKVSISDNGEGIAPEEADKIFIPFYTTKEDGSGIGLSLCRKIMRIHKGTISVISKPGEQTTFTLNF